jgi:hypothetical protein
MFAVELIVGQGWDALAVETKEVSAINVREAEIFARSWLEEVQKTCSVSPPTGYRIRDENGNPVLLFSLTSPQ